jgi:2,3-bisphosphoglycerate-dependent phosphoglycerate mutase
VRSGTGRGEHAGITNLYLIRHGEGMFAVHGRLAATGEIRPDVPIAGSLPRAQQTAAILAPAFGGVPVRLDDALQEMRYGAADGMLWADYAARFGGPMCIGSRCARSRPAASSGWDWGRV